MPLHAHSTPRWEVTHRPGEPTDFFPVNFDRSNLKEVSRVGDQFSRYVSTVTGTEYNCADFAAQARGRE